MSTGLVICDICHREVHQDGPVDANGRATWRHCNDKTPASDCVKAQVRYGSREEVVGKACFADVERANDHPHDA